VCRNGEPPQADGDLAASPDLRHDLAINLRAVGAPEELLAIVQRAMAGIAGEIALRHTGAFRPGRPQPEHRFAKVVL
jgi:hypothetical protein